MALDKRSSAQRRQSGPFPRAPTFWVQTQLQTKQNLKPDAPACSNEPPKRASAICRSIASKRNRPFTATTQLLVAPGITTRNKKLLVTNGIATSRRTLLVTRCISTRNKKLCRYGFSFGAHTPKRSAGPQHFFRTQSARATPQGLDLDYVHSTLARGVAGVALNKSTRGKNERERESPLAMASTLVAASNLIERERETTRTGYR